MGIRSQPRQTKRKKGPKGKVHEFRALFCEFGCFSWGKQARFTLNFCSGMHLRRVHELTFLWFGLPGPLLKKDANIWIALLNLKERLNMLGSQPKLWGQRSEKPLALVQIVVAPVQNRFRMVFGALPMFDPPLPVALVCKAWLLDKLDRP